MTTGAISGQAITLSVGGDLIAGATSFSFSHSQATINVTSKDDAFQTALIPGMREWTIDIDALYVYTDIGKKILLTAVNAGTLQPITVILTFPSPDSSTRTGTVIVTSFNESMPGDGPVTYTCSLAGTGALTISAS